MIIFKFLLPPPLKNKIPLSRLLSDARDAQGRARGIVEIGEQAGKRAILSRIAAERGFYRGFIHEESGCGTGAGL